MFKNPIIRELWLPLISVAFAAFALGFSLASALHACS